MAHLLKCPVTRATNSGIGQHSTQSLRVRVKCKVLLYDGPARLKWPSQDSPHVTDNHQWFKTSSSQGYNWMEQVGLKFFWWTLGLPTLSWHPILETSSPKPLPFWVTQEKQSHKDSPRHLSVARMVRYFPTCSWWFLGAPFLLGRDILTKLGTTIMMGKFSVPMALQHLIRVEKLTTASPIRRNFIVILQDPTWFHN